MSAYPYLVEVAPGCHGQPVAPIVSRHRTIAAAVRAARRSDRVRVVMADGGRVLYQAPERGHPRLGGGRLGRGPQRGEPRISECIADAEWIADEVQS